MISGSGFLFLLFLAVHRSNCRGDGSAQRFGFRQYIRGKAAKHFTIAAD
jgi:hypothetical protein